MFQPEPLYFLPLPGLLLSVIGMIVLALLLVVLVEITCLFCAVISDRRRLSGTTGGGARD